GRSGAGFGTPRSSRSWATRSAGRRCTSAGISSSGYRTRLQYGRVVSREDDGAGVAERAQAVGGGGLGLEVVAERREAVVVQAGGEVGDVAAQDEPLADANRLVAGSVAGCQQQLDRSVAEQVVVA